MKYNLVWLCACLCVLTACRPGQKKAESDAVEVSRPAMRVTRQDSVAVTNMVTHFMDYLKEDKCDEAAAMIYELRQDDPREEPVILDEQAWKQMISYLKGLAVSEYHIEHILFKRANDNEVKCSIRVADSYTTNFYLKPVRFLGNWYLCLKDSSAGDKAL